MSGIPRCKFAPHSTGPRLTIAQAAAVMNVSVRSVKYASELLATGRDDIITSVEAGELSLHAALRIAKPEKYGRKKQDGLKALKSAWSRATPDERETFLLFVGGRP